MVTSTPSVVAARNHAAMTDEAAEHTKPDPGPKDPIAPLVTWERTVAFIAGAASLGAGAVATFQTENDAGTAVLLIVGAAFILVGIQATPLIKIGGDKGSIELERRRLIATQVVVEASRDESPEVAQQVIDAVVRLEPSVGSYVNSSLHSTMALARDYEREIQQVLLRSGLSFTVQETSNRDLGWDFAVEVERERVVFLEVLWARRGRIGSDRVNYALGRIASFSSVDNLARWVVVTNVELTAQSLEQLARFHHAQVSIVVWRSHDDDDRLIEAIRAT